MATGVTVPVSRRSALGIASGLSITALASTYQPAAALQEAGDVRPVTGEFVGAGGPAGGDHMDEIFVAVIAETPAAAATARRVRAYLCDGHSFDAWFVGEIDGDDFDLTSEDGTATIAGQLTADAANGTFTVADGEAVPFAADRAAGRGGLYNLYIRDDLSAFGASHSGSAVVLTIDADQGTALFLLPNADTQAITAPVIAYPTLGDVAARLIVLDGTDNHLRGATRVTESRKRKDFVFVCEV